MLFFKRFYTTGALLHRITQAHARAQVQPSAVGFPSEGVRGQGIGQRPSDSFVIGPQSKTMTLPYGFPPPFYLISLIVGELLISEFHMWKYYGEKQVLLEWSQAHSF